MRPFEYFDSSLKRKFKQIFLESYVLMDVMSHVIFWTQNETKQKTDTKKKRRNETKQKNKNVEAFLPGTTNSFI